MSVRFSRMLGRTSKDSTENGFKWKFRDILAQNYIIWMICTMLAVKHTSLYQCNQGIVAKYSNLECKCSIAMIMMHPRDGWLQCQCNKMMDEMVHMTRCICHDAGPMMHTPWCKNDDALDVCMYEMHKIWCIHKWICDAHNATRVLWQFPRD